MTYEQRKQELFDSSTRTRLFHGLRQRPAYEEGLLHCEAKVGTEHTA